MPQRTTPTTVYGLSALDERGRIADRAIMRALGWCAGLSLNIAETHRLVLIHTDPNGVYQVTSQGHLRIPAALRHRCGLHTGDRVLLAAHTRHSQLVIYPPAALDTLLAGTTPIGGAPA